MIALYFTFSVMTAFTGTYWGANPFEQPGVEEGKVYIRDALKRKNSEDSHSRYEDKEREKILAFARKALERKIRYTNVDSPGRLGPESFDCSGFV